MNSPLAYIGGKSILSKTIVPMIPKHQTYCEVFAGAGWIFFKKEPSKYEVINDLDNELVTFYRVLQNHLDEFIKQFKWVLSSREWFRDWKRQQEAGGLTDIQKAARYYYLQRHTFGGRVLNRTFGAGPMRRPKINLLRIEEELSEVHLRLSGVVIENLTWQRLLKNYDKESTFFYLDPPYHKAPYYNFNMTMPDYQQLSDILRKIKGKFILSINDHPDMRTVFKPFKIKLVSVSYSANNKNRVEGKELLVSNY